MERIAKNSILILFKLFITAGLIYWICANADLNTIKQSLSLIAPMQLLGAACLHIGVFALGAGRWWVLLRRAGVSKSFQQIVPSYYLGVFFNNLLPSSMGGDVVRIVHLKMRGLSTRVLVGSAMIDRIIGLTTVVVMATVSIMFSPNMRSNTAYKIFLLILVGLSVLLLWFTLTPVFIRFIEKLVRRYRHTRIRKALLDIIVLCYSYKSAKNIILLAFGITLVMQTLVIMIYYYLGTGIGIQLPLITYFAIIPIVFLATSLPVSIGGLGVREGALVGLLLSANIDIQHAIALAILYLLVLWLSSLPGAIVLLFGNKREQHAQPSRP
ncbi:MAG: lysylphosphatidylglycerol synthase transmembrane domain-containing protein [Sulfuricaulis sp.]